MRSRYYVRKGRHGGFVVSYRDHEDRERQVKGSKHPLRRDAKAEADRLNVILRSGSERTDAERALTFAEYAEDYMAGKDAGVIGRQWVQSTSRGNRRAMTKDVLPYIGDHPLAVLAARPELIRKWAVQLRSRGFTPATVRTRLSLVSGVFSQALLDGLITVNPTDAVTIASGPSVMEEIVDPSVIWRIAAAMTPTAAILVDLQVGAGLRIGEAVAVMPADLDGDRLRIARQGPDSDSPDGDFEAVKGGRGSRSERVIPIDPALTEAIRAHVAEYGVSERGTIVANSWGGHMTQKRANGSFARARKRAGVTADVTPHDLRAYWISTLLADGVPVDLVARYAGHTIATLEKHYRRWIPSREGEFVAAVDGMYASLKSNHAGVTRALFAL